MAKKPVIVAIDDEVQFTDMLKEYFYLREYEIFISNKGSEGMRIIKEKKPDIIILDLKMPSVSGEEVLKIVKEKQPDAKVIFITAYDDGGITRARMLKAGAYAYLDKPLPSLKILEETIIDAFEEAG